MNIRHVIVHLLEKEQHQTQVAVSMRPDELPISNRLTTLLDHVRKLYNRGSGRGWGEFQEERFLAVQVSEYLEERIDFYLLTTRAVGELVGHLKTTPLSTGGYLLFVEYDERGDHFLMIVMLKSTPGLTFDAALEILDVQHLDLQKLHFAARVNLTARAAGRPKYISFIRGRATAGVTTYFKEFIGVTEYSDALLKTKELVNAVINYLDERGLPPEELEAEKSRVHAYCANVASEDRPVYLEDLSRFLDEENPTDFLEYANSEDVQLEDEIHIEKSVLKPLVRYYGKDKDVSISFSGHALKAQRVTYNPERDELTIHRVPVALRAQLSPE